MITCRCVTKHRDNNGKIIGYKLQDLQGVIRDVKPDQLKRAIKLNKIIVENLQLTKDDRLVDTKSQSLSDVFTVNRAITSNKSKSMHIENEALVKYEFNAHFSNMIYKFASEVQGVPGFLQHHHSGIGPSNESIEYKCFVTELRNMNDIRGAKDWTAEITFIYRSNIKSIKIAFIKIDQYTRAVTESKTKIVEKGLVDPVYSKRNLEIIQEVLDEFKKLIQ